MASAAHDYQHFVRWLHPMMEQADYWLSLTTREDDRLAVTVTLLEDLFPSDFQITDLTRQGFQGSTGFSNTYLERPEPGHLQERDIIFLLQRAYSAEQIVHGPVKVSDGEELTDAVVLGKEVTLLLQAKDSPNTAEIMGTKLERKRKKALPTPASKKKASKAFTPKLKVTLRVGNEFEGKTYELIYKADTLSSLLAEQYAVKAARKKYRYVEVVSVKSM